jgi:hypothetical protein
MNYGIALQQIYPELTIEQILFDLVFMENEQGQVYIAHWPYALAQPTIEEVEAAWDTWMAGELAREKVRISLEIDHQAEALRKKYLSPGEGKAMAYIYQQQCSREYRAMVAAGQTPTAERFPLMESRRKVLELKYGSATLLDVVIEWETLEQQWHYIESLIDLAVWKAKLDLEATQTVEAAQAVLTNIQWPPV